MLLITVTAVYQIHRLFVWI